jgi:hypothetical protein
VKWLHGSYDFQFPEPRNILRAKVLCVLDSVAPIAGAIRLLQFLKYA